MNKTLLKALQSVDTPSVCNAIEVAQGKRGFANFTRGTMIASAPQEGAMVGYALTAKIAGLEPPTESPEVLKTRRMDYYRYMAEGARPGMTVIEDLDYPHCISAYWGEINTTVHRGFGIAGALTNGVMRDLDAMPGGFPVVAGSIGPSHGFVHVRDIDCDVEIFGMKVSPGDLIHADRHGALVVPKEVIPNLETALESMIASEQLVLGPANEPGFDFDAFAKAWAAFEASRT